MSVGSFALGMISASDTFPKNMIIALCVLYFAFLIYKTAYRRKFKYGIAVVFLAVGFMSYSGIYNYKISGVKDFCDKNCDVYAAVLSSDYGTNSVKYTAKLTKINSENKNLKIMFYAPKGTKLYRGDEVVLRGVMPEIPKNIKNFDYNSYLKAKGVFLTVFAPSEKIEILKEGRGFLRFFGILRDRIIENNNKNLDGELAGVVNAITTGDKSGLAGNIKRAFSTSGVSHLLAISGLHLTILVSLIGAFLNDEFYAVRRFVKPIFSIITTVFIMLITGMGYSVMRAGIMLLIMNFSLLSGRGRNSVNSLMIAGTVIIFLNPYAVFDVGFELSFFATLGSFIQRENMRISRAFSARKMAVQQYCGYGFRTNFHTASHCALLRQYRNLFHSCKHCYCADIHTSFACVDDFLPFIAYASAGFCNNAFYGEYFCVRKAFVHHCAVYFASAVCVNPRDGF